MNDRDHLDLDWDWFHHSATAQEIRELERLFLMKPPVRQRVKWWAADLPHTLRCRLRYINWGLIVSLLFTTLVWALAIWLLMGAL